MDGLHNLIADKSENLRQVKEVRKDLHHRHEQRHLRREHHNAGVRRTSTGTRAKQGDLVLMKEADSALHNDCVHVKPTHDRWTGPWTVTAVITPGKCYPVTLQGRRERVRRAAASHIKPYNLRAPSLRHDFGDEYAHFAWGPDSGLGAASKLASPLFTVVDRCTMQLPNGSWRWRCRERYLNGSLSGFIVESECLDSFSPMQLGIFHALWELYQRPCHRPRPAAKSTSSERLAANRAYALLEVPIGTVVWRDFIDQQGRIQRCRTEVYFFLSFFFFHGPHHYHPACGHKGSSHLSPVHALQFFYRDASSALLQLVSQWLNFTYSRSHAFRYERKNTNPTLVRIELTTSVLADVQLTY